MLRISLIVISFLAGTSAFAQGFKIPTYTSFKLKNGLKVYLMEAREVPVISVSVILPAGAVYDNNQSGLASFTARGLMFGTKKYPKAVLDETIDFMGASINASAAKEFASLEARFASKDQEKMLDIIKELLTNATFDTAEFSKAKARSIVNLEQMKESPRSMIRPYFEKFMYGSHPYGTVVAGTVPSVSKMSAADLKIFYANNYLPAGAAIAIVGDFQTAKMKKQISSLLQNWKGSPATKQNLSISSVNFPKSGRVLLVNKDDARETTFYIGSGGVSRNNSDMVALQVLNTYFGGRFTSLLNDELRVNTGLTYGASSSFSSLKNAGVFAISTFTANKTTEAAMDKALEVVAQFQKGIDEANLTSAKNYVKGQFPPRYETSSQLASLLTDMFWYNIPDSYINDFEKNVDGLTVEKANQLIAKYFPKDNFQFVVIGKSAEIKDMLKKFGAVTEKDIKGEVE